jgi:hypothetical protein
MQAPTAIPAAVYPYTYMAAACVATLDTGKLALKQGIRRFEVPLPTLRQLFVQSTGGGAFQVLYLTTEPAPGKRKVFRFYANAGQPAFAALVAALVTLLPPGGDLRALDEKAALRTMGARDLDKVVGAVMFALIFGGVTLGVSPKLVHGIDTGEQKLTVAELGELRDGGSLESRNVVLTKARVLDGWTLAVTTVNKKNGIETGRSTRDYVPIVPKDWERDEPIHVVLETKHGADLGERPIRGIARTVMWEGLGSDQRAWFQKKIGAKIAKDAVLVELRAEPSTDLYTFLGVEGGMLAIGGLIAGVVVWKRRKK